MNYNTDPRLRRVAAPVFALALTLGFVGCGGEIAAHSTSPSTLSEANHSNTGQGLYDAAKKLLAAHIISSFENSTTEIQYDYAENIHDGRGITAGRAGFTSGTGDLLEVVKRYSAKKPDNLLAPYLPGLSAINAKPKDKRDTKGLDGFSQAWHQASDSDPLLNQAQDEVVDELYFKPAMKRATALGIQSPLGQLIILDTVIQHGEGNDQDGLPAIIHQTLDTAGPVKNERGWLNAFLRVRKQHLENAANPDTRQDWRESVSRVEALHSFLQKDNLELNPPLTWRVYGDEFTCDAQGTCN